jgi:hypothetical protein
MIKKFKKPTGIIVKYDSKVHSKEYLAMLMEKFEEVRAAPPKPRAVKKTVE